MYVKHHCVQNRLLVFVVRVLSGLDAGERWSCVLKS